MYVYPNVSFPSSPLCSPTTVSLTCTPSHSLAPTLLRLTRPYTYPCRPPSPRPSPFPPSFCARPAHPNTDTTVPPDAFTIIPRAGGGPLIARCPRRNVAPRAHAHEAGAARATVRASTPRTPDSWEVQVRGQRRVLVMLPRARRRRRKAAELLGGAADPVSPTYPTSVLGKTSEHSLNLLLVNSESRVRSRARGELVHRARRTTEHQVKLTNPWTMVRYTPRRCRSSRPAAPQEIQDVPMPQTNLSDDYRSLNLN
ncbi:hypothetical protein C2E23DRAFT_380262 [Lenzites betulinus]|nr:hypothetical protein C2E23DRAFT_380262 [Lenzites betulinus]